MKRAIVGIKIKFVANKENSAFKKIEEMQERAERAKARKLFKQWKKVWLAMGKNKKSKKQI